MLVFGLGLVGRAVEESSTATATALSVIRLSVDHSTIDFGSVGETEYDTGYAEEASAQTLTIKTNRTWVLNVKANSAVFSYSGDDADPSKPCADLQWKSASSSDRITATQASYTGLATSDAQLATGNRGQNIGVDTSFKLLVGYESDPAGDYSLILTYTLTTP